jgi:predicted DNA-binding protein with PD1-like motif
MATTVSGKLTEIILARFDPHEDLRQGLMKIIKGNKMRSGMVLSVTGALEKAVLEHPSGVGPPTIPLKVIQVQGPMEVTGHGFFGEVDAPAFGKNVFGLGDDFIHAEPYLHVHLVVTSAKETICGHLLDGCLVRANHPISHFTVVLARIEGAMVKMVGKPGAEPGAAVTWNELVNF